MHSSLYDGVFARWLYLLILVSHNCRQYSGLGDGQREMSVIGAALITRLGRLSNLHYG